jgi:hypothetical protein
MVDSVIGETIIKLVDCGNFDDEYDPKRVD